MNEVQKRLYLVGLTLLLILFTSVALYGQLPANERVVFYLDSNGHLHALVAPSGLGWTDVDIQAKGFGVPIAAASSPLTSLVDNLDYAHVYYITTSNQICEILIVGFVNGLWSGSSVSGVMIP